MATKPRKPAEDFSDQLRKFIEASPLTLGQLSDASGVNRSQLSRFVRGIQPSLTSKSIGDLMGPLKLKLVRR